MGSTEEPERKRRHLSSSMSPTPKKQTVLPSSDEKKVDPGMLQYQNQKLTQQLDVQRDEINALESKYNCLKNKQTSYDSTLNSVQSSWGQLTDKLEHLATRISVSAKAQSLNKPVSLRDGVISQLLQEEAFLQRLLEKGATESSNGSMDDDSLVLSAMSRQADTTKSVENLVCAINSELGMRGELLQELRLKMHSHDGVESMLKLHEGLTEEVLSLRSMFDTLHLKHKDLGSQVRLWRRNNARDQAELRLLTGELNETISDLECTRQRIAALRSQKEAAFSVAGSVRVDGEDGERSAERSSRDAKALESALEEVKSLASRRLRELEESRQEKVTLSEHLQQVQMSWEGEQHIFSSHTYNSLAAQVQFLKREAEQYMALVDTSQAEREDAVSRGKDAKLKTEASEAMHKANLIAMERLVELESQVQDSVAQRNSLHVRLEETSHALDRQDEVAEFKVMVSTLQKEMSMMQQQLDKYKEAVLAAELLRAEVESTSVLLERKGSECRFLADQIVDQTLEVCSLRNEVKSLRESEQELKLILDMYGSEPRDTRDCKELEEAERRVWEEVEKLKIALEDHSFELRVKAANEAEAACQERLAAAEAEVADLSQRLDASNRIVIELNEAAKMKNEEHDAYLAEIETIGQAYEDMQTQNQRLLQQISKRDDYNIKLVSESIKAKQLQASLLDEKQVLVHRIHYATSGGEGHKQKMIKLEEQVGMYLEQLGKAIEDGRKHASSLEMLKRRSSKVEQELWGTKSSIETIQKEIEQRKVKTGDLQARLEKEKIAKRKAQDELSSLKSKAACSDAQSDGSPLIEKLQEEIKECKAILKCGVCHDRPKEVVITKCYHLFCGPCIQRNLEIRHRKCPGCGINFGQNDVRNVYI